ncbi:alginate export family protein [Alloacidobacterium dinghuense]|uniref:Alginate export family protein n=1 Tax=Alloacidobacterium dinghuense TaxID=2763107 RepID=A0A7G8BF60_9BACT|nr:alginate export family protein [Alloacidobacterium dinghuense]QNI31180.1 alginate export family protein [Alloacidobacterium dinghuense]
MRFFPMLAAAVLLVTRLSAGAQAISSALPDAPDRTIKLLREDEDWSFLANPANRDFWDPVKYIRLRRGRDDWFMTISGEAREVWEQIGNDYWGQAPYWNGYLNERYMLGLDVHYGQHVRTFVDFKSGINSYRQGGPRPIDEKKLDFQAALLQVGTAEGQNFIELRAGIQELEYGSGRLIDVREGPNVRLSFVGFLVKSKINAWSVDGFAMRPRLDKPDFFDDRPNSQVSFWGVYATRPTLSKTSLELYYLGLDRKQATYQRGTAQEVRHSIGGRFSRPIATERPGWDFDNEALWQFGTFGSVNIRAWTVATETGYRFPNVPLKPRFSVKADISSGDHPASNTLGTFYPLFPKGDYFGVLATTGPGPINFIDVHPHVELALPHNVSASFDWIVQWRQTTQDGVYNVPGFLIRAADGSAARYVGDRPGTQIRWQKSRHLWFQGDYGIFYAGSFIKQTQPGRNLNYWALWTGYKF